jgi:LemA protein
LHSRPTVPSLASMTIRLYSMLLMVFALFTVGGCQNYDALVAKNENCSAKWADYEVQLQRRADLIGNLVETVKASSKFEQETLTKVTQARAEATQVKLQVDDFSDETKVAAFQKAQANLGALGRLMMTNEKYPDLQATKGYADLRVSLEGTENRLARSREQYNEAVRDYNTELGKIRGQVINKATGKEFKPRVYFTSSAESKEAPKVKFD